MRNNDENRVQLDEVLKSLFNVSKKVLVEMMNSLFREDYDIDNTEVTFFTVLPTALATFATAPQADLNNPPMSILYPSFWERSITFSAKNNFKSKEIQYQACSI